MPQISDGVDIHHTSYQSASRVQNRVFQSHHPAAIVHSIPPFHCYCSFHPATIVHSILPSRRYCSFHPAIPPLLFVPSHHPTAIAHSIPPSRYVTTSLDYFFKNKFEENIRQFKAYLAERDYPKKVIDNPLSEVKFKLDVNGPSSNREKQTIKSCPL